MTHSECALRQSKLRAAVATGTHRCTVMSPPHATLHHGTGKDGTFPSVPMAGVAKGSSVPGRILKTTSPRDVMRTSGSSMRSVGGADPARRTARHTPSKSANAAGKPPPLAGQALCRRHALCRKSAWNVVTSGAFWPTGRGGCVSLIFTFLELRCTRTQSGRDQKGGGWQVSTVSDFPSLHTTTPHSHLTQHTHQRPQPHLLWHVQARALGQPVGHDAVGEPVVGQPRRHGGAHSSAHNEGHATGYRSGIDNNVISPLTPRGAPPAHALPRLEPAP